MMPARTGRRGKLMSEEASAPSLPESGEAFFSYDEAGEILGVSKSTVRRLVARGELEAIRIGNQARLTASGMRRSVARAPSATERFRSKAAPAGEQHAA